MQMLDKVTDKSDRQEDKTRLLCKSTPCQAFTDESNTVPSCRGCAKASLAWRVDKILVFSFVFYQFSISSLPLSTSPFILLCFVSYMFDVVDTMSYRYKYLYIYIYTTTAVSARARFLRRCPDATAAC